MTFKQARVAFALFAVAFLAFVASLGPAAATTSGGTTLITGSGSSWASNAIQQWISDVNSQGLQVVFSPSGSANGRQDYANYIDDFAVSDIGFQGQDSTTGVNDTSNGRSYAYLPIVAGGTSLPYQIRVDGQLVRNLRLSGPTIAKIFSGKITNWNDPAITADNNGKSVTKGQSLTIIPVVHSEGSGSTYQFTRYLTTDFGSIWNTFDSVGATEYFPQNGGNFVRENGSDQLMSFLTSSSSNGAIGYDEYSYALNKNFPVAKVLNSGGYYTLPTQYNVAVALTKAIINNDKSSPNYLLQNLDNVYSYSDPRVYPISSYSYALIPTASNDQRMTTAKRQTIADYLDYSVCQGQAEMGKVGYSPLPINLVEASFAQVSKLHTADSGVDISALKVTNCHNPTFVAGHPSENYLAKVAPQPQACDRQGAGPCVGSGFTNVNNPGKGGTVTQTQGGGSSNSGGGGSSNSGGGGGSSNSGGGGGSSNSGGGGTTKSAGGGGGTTNSAGGGGSTTNSAGGGGSTTNSAGGGGTTNSGGDGSGINQTTGQPSLSPISDNQVAQPQATPISSSQSPSTDITLGVIAGALLLALLIIPPVVSARMSKGPSA